MQKPIAITLREATTRTGIKRSAFYKIFNAGALVPRKRGKSLLLIVEELDSYVLSLPARPSRPAAPEVMPGSSRPQRKAPRDSTGEAA